MALALPRPRRSQITKMARHPNELDRMRIARSIEERQRYRYVEPQVRMVDSGYLVRSPCCSRNVDPDGGMIDIAQIVWMDDVNEWSLWRHDHGAGAWVEDSRYARLGELLLRLNADPARQFWQ